VPIDVVGDGPWTLLVGDLATGPDRGHMVPLSEATRALRDAMTAGVEPAAGTALDASDPVQLASGSGPASVVVRLGQGVGPTDPPGTYQISLVFSVVTGF